MALSNDVSCSWEEQGDDDKYSTSGKSTPDSRRSEDRMSEDMELGPELSQEIVEPSEKQLQETRQVAADEAPYHTYKLGTKKLIVLIISAVGTLSGLSSNIYFPAQAQLSKSLGVSHETINLSITTYMIAQGLSPSFWGALADHQGRRMTLILTLLVYVGANVALALTSNGAMLLVFRACQAAGSASTIALGSGIIADMFPASERGQYIGWFSGVRQFSLAFGPVIGGVLAGNLGWRSIFWFLVIFSALSVVLIILCLPETLRRISGNGDSMPPSWKYRPLLWSFIQGKSPAPGSRSSDPSVKPPPPITVRTFTAPFELMLEPDVFCALIFGGCVYTAWSMMVASTAYTLQKVYKFDTMQVGFAFLANGIGCVAGSVLAGKSLNFDFHREVQLWRYAQNIRPDEVFPAKAIPTSFQLEYARLSKGPLYAMVCMWGLLLFGWSLTGPPHGPSDDPKSHWITPLLAQAAVGWSATSVLTSNSALVVDLFPGKSASVSAVMNMSRCLLGAAGVAGVEPFLRAFAPGWTSVLLVSIVAVGMVPYILHAIYGQQWRENRERRLREKA